VLKISGPFSDIPDREFADYGEPGTTGSGARIADIRFWVSVSSV
jgi:hypothetical protein